MQKIAKMFLRFIDDLFMIWSNSEQEQIDFMSGFEQETFFDHIQI